MARQPIGDITEVTPSSADKVLGVDVSDSNKAKNFLVPDLLGVGFGNWAEVRDDGSQIVSLDTGTDTAFTFDTNVAGSAAAAGDADAGSVITADQANDQLIIPAKTRVLVKVQADFSAAGSDIVYLKVQADGSDVAELTAQTATVFSVGPPLISVNPAVSFDAIYENDTSSTVALTLVGRSTLTTPFGITTTRLSMRAAWVADLP